MQKLMKQYRENRKNNKGFTLVELIVVIAILGVLMAVLVPQYIKYVDKSKAGTDLAALGEVLHAAEVDAALTGTDMTYDVAISTSGEVTVPTQLIEILGTKIQLKSSAAKPASAATHTIKVAAAAGTAGWGATGANTTEAEFPTIKNLAG